MGGIIALPYDGLFSRGDLTADIGAADNRIANVYAGAFHGDGSNLTNLPGGVDLAADYDWTGLHDFAELLYCGEGIISAGEVNLTGGDLKIGNVTLRNRASNILTMYLNGGTTSAYYEFATSAGFKLHPNCYVAWSPTNPTATPDLTLYREAAGILAQRNGTNTQAFRVYNTYTDDSNYERASIRYVSNVLTIGHEYAGTGAQRWLNLSGNTYVFFSVNGSYKAQISSISFNPNSDLNMDNGGISRRWITTYSASYANNGTDPPNFPQGLSVGAGTTTLTTTELKLNDGVANITTKSGAHTFKVASKFGTNNDSPDLVLFGGAGLGFVSGSFTFNTLAESRIVQESAGILAQRNGANTQAFRVYNTYTDASNNEYLETGFDTNIAYVRTAKNGTGAARRLVVDSSSAVDIKSTGGIYLYKQGGSSSYITLFNNDLRPRLSGEFNLGTVDFPFGGIFGVKVHADRLSQVIESAAAPTTTEFPTADDWGIHRNTVTGDITLAFNDGGTIVSTTLT